MYITCNCRIRNIISNQNINKKIGKIADNYKWYYVISVNKDEAEMFKEGKTLKVNFADQCICNHYFRNDVKYVSMDYTLIQTIT